MNIVADPSDLVRHTIISAGHAAALKTYRNPFGEGGQCGHEFYGPDFPGVYQNALRNFRQFHRRHPDAQRMRLAADHIFFSKFFRYVPREPNASSKLNA